MHEVAVDPSSRVEAASARPPSVAQPPVDEVESRRPAGLASASGQRPSWRWSPIAVAADRLERDELVEEGLRRWRAKVGHGRQSRRSGPLPSGRHAAPPDLGPARHARRAARSAWSRSPSATSRTWRASPSMTRSGAGRSPGRQDDAGLRAWLDDRPGQRRGRHRGPVRDHRPRHRPGDRQQPLHDHRAGASAARDRLDLGRDGGSSGRARTARPSSSSSATPSRRSTPSASSSRRMPGTSGHGRPSSASARRSRASSATTRSCPTARIRDSAFYSVIAARVAGGQGPARGPARAMTDDAASLERPITTVDYHTGGEPFRIVTGGVPTSRARTVLERRRWADGPSRSMSAACWSTSHAATPTCTARS